MANPSARFGMKAAVLIWQVALWLISFLFFDFSPWTFFTLAMVPAMTCTLQIMMMNALHFLGLWATRNNRPRLAYQCHRAFYWVTLSSPPNDFEKGRAP